MKLLVTGAAGMLGRDVMLAAGNAGHDVVGFGRAELDVTDPRRPGAQVRPRAARRGHQLRRLDRRRRRRGGRGGAFAVNGNGAGNVAAAAAEGRSARSLHVSTDYVFDGAKGAPYVESDQPAPLSAYGRTKLAGEEAVAAANKRHFIVRSAGLFGIGGRNFVDTMLRLAEAQNEVTVVRDQVGSPTYTWHLAYGIVRLIEGIEYGIHHMAAGGPVLLVRVRPRDLRAGQGRVQSALDHQRGIRRRGAAPGLLGPGQPARARDPAPQLAGRPGRLSRPTTSGGRNE